MPLKGVRVLVRACAAEGHQTNGISFDSGDDDDDGLAGAYVLLFGSC